MRILFAILVYGLLALVFAAEDDYSAVFSLGGRLDPANYSEYTPAFAEFLARDYPAKNPVHLGFYAHPLEPVKLYYNRSNVTFPGWRFYEGNFTWSYNLPEREISPLAEYHVLPIVEFLEPGYKPPGMNYSGYVPVLEEFVRGRSKPLDYSQHIPAIEEFLSENWQPAGPNPNDYPPGLTEYLKD